MAESIQHKLSRVRKPRVHITYDVHVGDSIVEKEIPYVVGVLANLSGMPKNELPPISERQFVNIDRDNINSVLKKSNPRLLLEVKNTLDKSATDPLSVEILFNSLEDFEPQNVVKQIPNLSKLLVSKGLLQDLLSKAESNNLLKNILKLLVENKDLKEKFTKLISEKAAAIVEKKAEEVKGDDSVAINDEISAEIKSSEKEIISSENSDVTNQNPTQNENQNQSSAAQTNSAQTDNAENKPSSEEKSAADGATANNPQSAPETNSQSAENATNSSPNDAQNATQGDNTNAGNPNVGDDNNVKK